ncbi:MAG TPA: FG-GAP-like repeat-containing protein [Terriglobales bacterium]|nr:FG-GAP-like repeat-containing protein [Terriglobales bacterium]
MTKCGLRPLIVLMLFVLVEPAFAQFETRSNTPVSPFPTSVAVGDFNRDGTLDCAVVTPYDNHVSVLLGKGDGTFGAAVKYGVGDEPASVATADFNHDNVLDLVIASSQGVSILLGNGDGTFKNAVTYETPEIATYIATADFNGDHNLDVVVIDFREVSVLLGNGDGTFQEPAINTYPSIAPSSLGVGDFDRDGTLDLAIGEQFGGSGEAEILLGNGDGSFRLTQSYPISPDPLSVVAADFRANGILDLAVACNGGRGISVLLGNGDGTFQPAVTYSVPSSYWVTTGDFNGDRKLDLAVAQFLFPPGVSVLSGNGDGTFQQAKYYPDGSEVRFVAVGDVNGDNRADLVVADTGDSLITVLLNTGVVTFSPTTPLSFPRRVIKTTSPPQTVTLTNTGSTALTISSISVQGQFLLNTSCRNTLEPGAICFIKVAFRPTSPGAQTDTVSIHDSASSKPQVIEVKGVGTVVNLVPSSLTFPDQKIGTTSSPQNLSLTNVGNKPLNFTSIKVTGNNAKDFAQSNTCGSQIPAGANCTISVTFTPTKTGLRKANISVSDDGGGSPQTVSLSGTGD